MGKTKPHSLAQGNPPGAATNPDPISTDRDNFQKATSILDGQEGFGGTLWDAEMRVAFDAREKIRDSPESARQLGRRGELEVPTHVVCNMAAPSRGRSEIGAGTDAALPHLNHYGHLRAFCS